MKFDPLKSFGYPVLRPLDPNQSPELADYVKSSFQPSFKISLDSSDPSIFVISYDFTALSLRPLKKLIEEQKATFIIRIECRETFYSLTKEVGDVGEIKIEGDQLRDWVKLCGYVTAKQKLVLKSDKINEEFGYTEFEAEKATVLAWAPPTTYSVEKDFYRNIRSIFEYREDSSLNNGQFFVDLDEEYVFIHANSSQIKHLRNAEATKGSQLLVLNSVFYPVVLQMAMKIRDDEEETLQRRWGKIFAAKCAAKGINYNDDPNLTAQAILGRPLNGLNTEYFGN